MLGCGKEQSGDSHLAVAAEVCGPDFAAGMMHAVAPIHVRSTVIVGVDQLVCQGELWDIHGPS